MPFVLKQPHVLQLFDLVFPTFFLSGRRPDISEGLRKLQCRSLIFVGESSPFHSEAVHMTSKIDRRYSALVEVWTRVYISLLGFLVLLASFCESEF